MVGYWQGCRLVIIAFGLILMFMSAADALRRQCSQAFGIYLKSSRRHGKTWATVVASLFFFFPHSLQISGASSMGAAAVHRAYCMPLQFDCRTTGKRKRERLPAWQLNSNNRQSHNVFSLYGWLLARVQTGNYCIWIDSDVHVRSRCIAPAMFSHRFKLFFSESSPPNIAQCQCGWALVHVFKPCHRVFFCNAQSVPDLAIVAVCP